MSSPEENSSKDKDTNGIQNPEAQSGLQKAGELSHPSSSAAVKQLSGLSRAEPTPALQHSQHAPPDFISSIMFIWNF